MNPQHLPGAVDTWTQGCYINVEIICKSKHQSYWFMFRHFIALHLCPRILLFPPHLCLSGPAHFLLCLNEVLVLMFATLSCLHPSSSFVSKLLCGLINFFHSDGQQSHLRVSQHL